MENTGTLGNFVEIKEQKIELEGATLLDLNELRKWTQFLSVLGFVAVGLLLLVGVIMFVASMFVSPSLGASLSYQQLGFLGPFFGVFYFVIAAVYFFPVLYLYRFSQHARHSLVHLGSGESSSGQMALAITYLKKHFRYIGVVTIIMLSAYLVVIIGVLIAVAIR